MYRVLVVDDEPLARSRLKRLLAHEPEFQWAGEAEHGEAALSWLAQQQADLVLLDIQMPGMDGLATAAALQQLPQAPRVIFCTAYDEHALAAFRVEAVDYLLKPVRPEELSHALKRAAERLQTTASSNQKQYIIASGHKGIERIDIETVLACIAEQKYVEVYHQAGVTLIDEPLKQLEQDFPAQLIRSHRGALVAKAKIVRLSSSTQHGAQLWLQDLDRAVPVSRRHLASIKACVAESV